jgi:hypothetical protein
MMSAGLQIRVRTMEFVITSSSVTTGPVLSGLFFNFFADLHLEAVFFFSGIVSLYDDLPRIVFY